MWLEQLTLLVVKYSPVTIIVVTIFIAIFQNYRIVFLLRYFMCVRNDIFARYLRYANTIELTASLLKFQHASITLQSRAAKDVTRVIAARRPWLSSVSVRKRRRNCLWSNLSQVVSLRRAVFMTSQLKISSVRIRCGFQVSVVCSVWIENYKSISLCRPTGLNILSLVAIFVTRLLTVYVSSMKKVR